MQPLPSSFPSHCVASRFSSDGQVLGDSNEVTMTQIFFSHVVSCPSLANTCSLSQQESKRIIHLWPICGMVGHLQIINLLHGPCTLLLLFWDALQLLSFDDIWIFVAFYIGHLSEYLFLYCTAISYRKLIVMQIIYVHRNAICVYWDATDHCPVELPILHLLSKLILTFPIGLYICPCFRFVFKLAVNTKWFPH